MQARVSDLKKQLEHLFPGKWLTDQSINGIANSGKLLTGMPEIDKGITRGIARKRITEWTGPISCGKTTLLRTAITNWCAAGLNVAYIDVEGKLLASDWAFVQPEGKGKFWLVCPSACKDITPPSSKHAPKELLSKGALYLQEALWSADQFIRCNAFDAVILDFGSINPFDIKRKGMVYNSVPSRVSARFKRSLDRSKAALIMVRDMPAGANSEGWGTGARFSFDWGTSIRCEAGLGGNVMITPTIKCNIMKDGINQKVEVSVASSAQNRLFTHPQVPDRRTSKK